MVYGHYFELRRLNIASENRSTCNLRGRDMLGSNPLAGIQRESDSHQARRRREDVPLKRREGRRESSVQPRQNLLPRPRSAAGLRRDAAGKVRETLGDYPEAMRWYRKAADQGYANAQYALGFMYHKGQGVPQDNAEAVRWYRKAADQGYANAQYALGFTYHKGQGVPQDDAEAVRWYAKIVASCFASTQASPLQRWTSILVLVLVLPVLAVPKRRWGPAT